MSQKFHINKHGVPAPCRATKGNCPLGGDGEHFSNIEDAQEFANSQNESNYGLVPTLGSTSDDEKGSNTESAKSEPSSSLAMKLPPVEGSSSNSPFDTNPELSQVDRDFRRLDRLYEGNLREANKPRRFPMSLIKRSPEEIESIALKKTEKQYLREKGFRGGDYVRKGVFFRRDVWVDSAAINGSNYGLAGRVGHIWLQDKKGESQPIPEQVGVDNAAKAIKVLRGTNIGRNIKYSKVPHVGENGVKVNLRIPHIEVPGENKGDKPTLHAIKLDESLDGLKPVEGGDKMVNMYKDNDLEIKYISEEELVSTANEVLENVDKSDSPNKSRILQAYHLFIN